LVFPRPGVDYVAPGKNTLCQTRYHSSTPVTPKQKVAAEYFDLVMEERVEMEEKVDGEPVAPKMQLKSFQTSDLLWILAIFRNLVLSNTGIDFFRYCILN
jgi:hypothetical protein